MKGTSSLHLELTELGVADGQQVQIKTQMVQRNGPTSVGRDAAAIGGTTALGAAVGGSVAGGFGAGMGAIGGFVVSGVGVLVTRGRPTVVYPEMALTFRLENPVTVTGDSNAFVPNEQGDYRGGPAGPGPRYGYGPPAPRPYAPAPIIPTHTRLILIRMLTIRRPISTGPAYTSAIAAGAAAGN